LTGKGWTVRLMKSTKIYFEQLESTHQQLQPDMLTRVVLADLQVPGWLASALADLKGLRADGRSAQSSCCSSWIPADWTEEEHWAHLQNA